MCSRTLPLTKERWRGEGAATRRRRFELSTSRRKVVKWESESLTLTTSLDCQATYCYVLTVCFKTYENPASLRVDTCKVTLKTDKSEKSPHYYINTNEIPGELSRENLISSRVKITCYLHMWKYHRCYDYIINRAFHTKKLLKWNGLVVHWCLCNK